MTRKGVLTGLTGAVALTLAGLVAPPRSDAAKTAPTRAPSVRPNIVVIVFDDTGFSDFGAYGSEIRTPNIDALAMGGLRYTRFDTRAVCSATRAALLTGRNNQTVRMADLPSRRTTPDPNDTSKNKGELPANAETVASALAATGYATFAVGKWHLSPAYEGGPGGPADPGGTKASWPLQRGFERYYGFLGGWTDQYRPKLIAGNAPIPTPDTAGYMLSADLIDHAIDNLASNRKTGRPAFLYLGLGASHSPIQAPRTYIDRYRGRYDAGWDVIRAERFARMKRLGIVPAGTVLPPRNAGDAAWTDLDPQRKRVFARFMEVYAGFIEYADAQVGRLVDHLKRSGQFDNTLIVLMSDNGGAPEGGAQGGFRTAYGDATTVAEMDARLDELGGPTTHPLYQRPWGMVSSTPFRRYKLWPYAGGTRDPLIISWPRGIAARGAVRTQAVDVIDIAPTLTDVAGAKFARTIAGVPQIPVAGRSFRASFASGSAPAPRSVQYFELRGNRAIRVGRWKAVAMHRPDTPFESDSWQLFDTTRDFAEANDVAARYPKILATLKARWMVEARRYASPPIDEMPAGLRAFNLFDEP